MSLQNKIKESAVMVTQIKNGKSLFDNTDVIRDYHVPVFKKAQLKQSL